MAWWMLPSFTISIQALRANKTSINIIYLIATHAFSLFNVAALLDSAELGINKNETYDMGTSGE